ncbi:MAG: hypothetical protein HIU84_02445 [Acidobacteria bacterium]|nr:hypothetical protein [Acidobacteriota bacterium]
MVWSEHAARRDVDDHLGARVTPRARSPRRRVLARWGDPTGRDETGATLILALVFLVVVSLIGVSLANWVGSDLGNVLNFRSARAMQTTANSAAELAVQNLRYNFDAATLNASPPVPCWTTSPTPSQVTLNAQSMSAWCTTRWQPLSTSTRIVTITTCPSSLSASACARAPLLLSVVTFDDYGSSSSTIGTAQCSVACGTAMRIDGWVFDATPPTVTAVTAAGPLCTTTPMNITGTGFVSGATSVHVIVDPQSNLVLAATNVNVLSATSLSACSPSGTGSGDVTVTTPIGTSLATSTAFNY